jgi:poly(A) polymerase
MAGESTEKLRDFQGRVPMKLPVPAEPKAAFATWVVRRLKEAGFEAVWAGGCVRDLLLGLRPADYDVATSARPDQVQKLFPRTVAVGAAFGVILVLGRRNEEGQVQVATFREEGPYSDGRRPDSVRFSSMEADARRRDFTINGMFYDPVEQVLYDFVGGRFDLEAKTIRAIGNPRARFKEDKLRLIRALRFAARLQFRLDPETAQAIRDMAAEIVVVSAERILAEWKLMLEHSSRTAGLKLCKEFGLLKHVMPEVDQLDGQGRTEVPEHQEVENLWAHTLSVLDQVGPLWDESRPARKLVATANQSEPLLKALEPSPQRSAPGSIPFCLAMACLCHCLNGSVKQPMEMEQLRRRRRVSVVRRLCQRLRFSNEERLQVEWLVANRSPLLRIELLRPSEWKRLMLEVLFPDLYCLARADALVLGLDISALERAWQYYQDAAPEELNPPPLITGNDLRQLGLPPGPHYAELLQRVRDAQLNGELTDRQSALRQVERWILEQGLLS